MNACDAIWSNSMYQTWYLRLQKDEESRLFCCHGIVHFLDTARIAYIMNIEEELGFSKDLIYATALLHDIGKAAQYEEGLPHEEVGARLAEKILNEIEQEARTAFFSDEEKALIVRAIREHRNCPEGSSNLGKLMYRADKASRACFACSQQRDCSWSDEKKNLSIRF